MSVSRTCTVIFAVDRAGLVGSDGETHQGIFDLSYLSSDPEYVRDGTEKQMGAVRYAEVCNDSSDGPIALRYPRGEAYDGLAEHAC